jgi:hypothetical protein
MEQRRDEMTITAKKRSTRWMDVWDVTDGEITSGVSRSKHRAEDGLPSYAAGIASKGSFSPLSPWVETFEEAAERAIASKRRFVDDHVIILTGETK